MILQSLEESNDYGEIDHSSDVFLLTRFAIKPVVVDSTN